MHILEISSFLPPYGGYFCIEQARALRARGHEVRVLLAQQLGLTVYPWHYLTARYGRWWETDGEVEIYRTNFRGLPRTIRPNVEHYCRLIGQMFDTYVTRYGKPDVLHAHCAKWAGVAAHRISERTGIPFFITEHFARASYEMDFGIGWQHDVWARELLRQTFSHAACVIPVARELVDDIAPLFGTGYRWQEISNLIDVDYFAYRERPSRQGRPFRLCCLAIANKGEFYRKGYDVLLSAFRGMEDAELHIAGRATGDRPMVEAARGIKGVVLHGDLGKAEVRELLYGCDALVLASRGEVQPLVLLEAMSTGIPVVSTEVVPQSERIAGACTIVPIGDAVALRRALEEVRHVTPSPQFHEAVCRLASPSVVAQQLEVLFSAR